MPVRLELVVSTIFALGCNPGRSGQSNSGGMGDSGSMESMAATGLVGATEGSGMVPEASTQGASEETGGESSVCTEVHIGDLVLSTQDDVEASARLREVQGSLTISGNVASLAALGCLETIAGGLTVDETRGLRNLEGLGQLADVGGWLTATSNPDLESLEGLSSLRFVSWIYLGRNGLTHLGLSDLQAAEGIVVGGCSLDGARDSGEPLLVDFDGLDALLALGVVAIYESPMLMRLSGLEAFAQRGGQILSLSLWFNEQFDLGSVTDATDLFEGTHIDACGNEGQSTERCFCPPPP
ncbi:MAG: hypothetical protein ACRBN8_27445 [Nannocystales bacterium]